MDVFCFLIISFAFANVSANDKVLEEYQAKYNRELFITNCSIELADHRITIGDNIIENGLEYVIEKIIYNEDGNEEYESFDKINFMIAAPEITTLVIGIPDIELYPNEILKAMHYQQKMQLELANTLLIGMFKNKEPHKNFKGIKSRVLADNRRRRVIPALVNIIRRVLDGTIRNNSVLGMCRLLGLYLSARTPTSYIQSLQFDSDDNICDLWNGSENIRYRKIIGRWGQIIDINGSSTFEPLEAQLPERI